MPWKRGSAGADPAHGPRQDHRRDEHEDKFARLVTAIGKYWICKRAPTMIAEASECLGGAGYVEETILPRLYREAPVNSIWEGSGNVQCLDVLRALSKEPGVLEVLFAELGDGHGDARLKVHIQRLKAAFGDTEDIQYRARQLTEEVAVTLQAKLLLEAGDAAGVGCLHRQPAGWPRAGTRHPAEGAGYRRAAGAQRTASVSPCPAAALPSGLQRQGRGCWRSNS